jgi:SNF2 family DNA or RNA helicase
MDPLYMYIDAEYAEIYHRPIFTLRTADFPVDKQFVLSVSLYRSIRVHEIPADVTNYSWSTFRFTPTKYNITEPFMRYISPFSNTFLALPTLRSNPNTYTFNIESLENYNFAVVELVEEVIADTDLTQYSLSIKVNKKKLGQRVRYEHKNYLLLDMFRANQFYKLQDEIENTVIELLRPANDLIEYRRVQSDLYAVQPFQYQKANVRWMQSIEARVRDRDNVLSYSYDLVEYIRNVNLYVIDNSIFKADDVRKDLVYKDEQRFYGGFLVDDMGLGKTFSMLSLIQEDLQTQDAVFEIDKSTCCYKYKRGKNERQFCEKKVVGTTQLFCREHQKSIFTEVRKGRHLMDSVPVKGNKIVSRATVVVSPSHLCEHWIRECMKNFSVDWNTVMLATHEQLKQVSAMDLASADLVVVSHNLLCSSKYKKIEEIQVCGSRSHLEAQMGPRLEQFHFRRIVFDEAHEINKLHSNQIFSVIHKLSSDFRWVMSGTPFAQGMTTFVQNYLLVTNRLPLESGRLAVHSYPKLRTLGMCDPALVRQIMSLYRQNTKESVRQNGVCVDTVQWLTFTNSERAIYDSYVYGQRSSHHHFLLQLCCHPELHSQTRNLVRQCKTLQDIEKVILQFHTKKLSDVENKITRNEKLLVSLQRSLQEQDDVSAKIGATKRALDKLRKEKDSLTRTAQFLTRALKQTEAFVCPICLDDDVESKSITTCGHSFCTVCLETALQTKANCPSCRVPLSANDSYVIIPESIVLVEEDSLQKIVKEVKSTKIGNIIHFLNETNSSDKIILFSQWDTLLQKINEYLVEYGILTACCQGTVFQRKRAIDAFRNDPNTKVLLLSSRSTASGLDLTCANKVVFVEPVYGSLQFKKDTENQAIGRADRIGQEREIEIVRFLIRDTIEENIHNGTADYNKLAAIVR